MCVKLKGNMPKGTRELVDSFFDKIHICTWVSLEKGLLMKQADQEEYKVAMKGLVGNA
jgi:hypothetical protein